jgi:prophage regulatory protein
MQNFESKIKLAHLREFRESANNLMQWRILRIKEVCALIGVSRSTVYNWINQNSRWHIPAFPKPVRLGNSAIGWSEDEILAYLRQAPRAGDAS